MSDLEAQLRECLSRHAAPVGADADLGRAARTASRRSSRRRQTAAILGIVPVTAGVVVGGVDLSGSTHSTPDPQTVQTLGSASPSAGPQPTSRSTSTHHALIGPRCPRGELLDIHVGAVLGRHRLANHPKEAVYYAKVDGRDLHVVTGYHIMKGKDFLVDGRLPVGTRLGVLVLVTQRPPRDGAKLPVLLSNRHRAITAYQARYLGCAAKP